NDVVTGHAHTLSFQDAGFQRHCSMPGVYRLSTIRCIIYAVKARLAGSLPRPRSTEQRRSPTRRFLARRVTRRRPAPAPTLDQAKVVRRLSSGWGGLTVGDGYREAGARRRDGVHWDGLRRPR